jgi:hypothetical protein
MRELYGAGLAVHAGPESCVRVREGACEALTGVRAGWAIEPRKLNKVWGADAVTLGGRQHRQGRYRESLLDPARSENLCTYGVSMRENREVPRLLVLWGRVVRERSRP